MNLHPRSYRAISAIVALFSALSGIFMAASCASAPPPADEFFPMPAEPTAEERAAMEAAAKEAEKRRLAQEESDARLAIELMKNDSGKTVIGRINRDSSYQTSYMIVSKSGTVLLVDPYFVLPGIDGDIIVSTHKDYDHNDAQLYARSSARKSLYVVESFSVNDVAVTGIPASHYGDAFDPAKPSDVIYLVEVDGLRLAFMGDISQTHLTEAQLSALGRVDVAVLIMEDAPSYGYSLQNSLAMLRQLGPRLAFPIHPSTQVVRGIADALGGLIEAGHRYEIDLSTLGEGKTEVVTLAPLP